MLNGDTNGELNGTYAARKALRSKRKAEVLGNESDNIDWLQTLQ